MTRINLVLLLAVMASALYLVRLQYESRRLVTALDRGVTETRRLEVEHERLQAEKRAQATPLRVEKLAKEQLHMRGATPAITQYVSLQATAPGAQATPAQPPTAAAPGPGAAGRPAGAAGNGDATAPPGAAGGGRP